MKLSENQMVCKLKDVCGKLTKYKLKESYDISVALVDEDDPTFEEKNTHRIKGSTECKLVKLLAIFGLVALTLGAIKAICAFFFED